MPSPVVEPDCFFSAEFGDGELSRRLWNGGLRANEEGYKLTKGTLAFTNTLQDGLDARFTEDGTLTNIVNDVETCWNDVARMRRACQPVSRTSTNLYSGTPSSLVKHLLSIDLFQPPIITCLINKISEMGEENAADGDLAPMLLNQLRWLDFIVDGTALCDNLLSILPVVSVSIQKEIIEAVPEILDDASKPQAVSELIRILQESPSLTGSIIDALTSLGIEDESLADVNSSIILTLGAANRDILPVTIKYLLRSCPPTLLGPTLEALRNTLALPSLGPGSGKLCLDAVRFGLRVSKNFAQHVLKTLRNIIEPKDFKPADFWLVIALYDSPTNRKTTEALFKRQAAVGAFNRALIDAALAPFVDAFTDLTSLIITLASVAVKSTDIGARRTGVFLYALLFRLFPSGNTRRNVITTLVEHTGTRKSGEVDTALDALVLISKESVDDRSLLPHSASIQNLLDLLEWFSDSQLRQLWTVFGYLCCASAKKALDRQNGHGQSTNSNQDVSVEDEGSGEGELQMLEILLRKELTHPDIFYRRIGVIGACTMVKVLGNQVKNNVLSLVLDVGRVHPFTQAVAFDELSELFSQDKSSSVNTSEDIRKKVSTLFENRYIAERAKVNAFVKDERLLPAVLFGNLEDDDVEFCFSIAALTRNEATFDEARDAVRSMVPNLRLLCVMTSNKFNGSLSEIDATIGAPLHIPIFPMEKDMDDVSAEGKNDLLLNLFIAHGWIVELINGFSEQESNELRAKCVMRVDNLIDIIGQISRLVPHIPRWKDVIFDAYNGTRTDSKLPKPVGAGKTKTNSNAKDKLGREASSDGSMEWKKLSRQLAPSALSLIRIRNPITWRYTETESLLLREGEPLVQTVTLSIRTLHYLLTELAESIDNVVGGSFRNNNALSVTMFHTGSITGPKKDGRNGIKHTAMDGGLKRVRALQTALESLSPQLARCLRKIFSKPTDASQREDEALIKLYRECAILCLQCLALSINSMVLSDSAAHEFLFSLLASVRLDGEPVIEPSDPMTTEDIEIAAKAGFEQLYIRMNAIISSDVSDADLKANLVSSADEFEFDGCCAMLAAMDSIFQYCSERQKCQMGPKLSKVAHAIMQHDWSDTVLRLRKTQKLIPGIVRINVQYASDALDEAGKLRKAIFREAERQAELEKQPVNTQDGGRVRSSEANGLGSLTEQTVFAYSIAILDQYIFLFKQFKAGNFEKVEDAFSRIERFIHAEMPLYSLARLNQRLIGPVMRAGRTFVELFLSSCLPFLNHQFRNNRSNVIQLCKMHQKPTRLLQSYCAHSKSTRDASLTGLVPPLRRCLELLLYQVKGLLHGHNATEAFQLGNLKHRDIHGEVVSSQQVEEEEGLGDEEDEEHDDDESEEKFGREDGHEEVVVLTEEDVDEGGNRKSGTMRPKTKSSEGRLGSARRQRLKNSSLQQQVRSSSQAHAPQELDFGSDGDDEIADTETARGSHRHNDDALNNEIAEVIGEELDEEEDIIRRKSVRRGQRRGRGVESLREVPRKRLKSVQGTSNQNSVSRYKEVDVTQRKRCKLIDDEADDAGSEDDEGLKDEEDLASQFLLMDDEVEE